MTTPSPEPTRHEASSTPLSGRRRSLWTRPWLWVVAVAGALLYGSLLPFDFQWARAVEHHGGALEALLAALAAPRWAEAAAGQSSLGISFAASDVLVNLLLYIPLGIALRMALRPRRWGRATELALVLLVGLCLSWGVEAAQSLLPARVASLSDIACNAGGALAGGLIAVPLWQGIKLGAFALYVRGARWRGGWRSVMDRPGVAMAIAGVNALVIVVWYVREVGRSAGGGAVLPFEDAFGLPYDLGALLLGEALLVYAGLGCLLLLLTYTGTRRLAMNAVVLGVVLLALAAELTRALTRNAVPDITGVLLALAAASIMTVTVYAFAHAVRRMDRRHRDEPYDGPERRRDAREQI